MNKHPICTDPQGFPQCERCLRNPENRPLSDQHWSSKAKPDVQDDHCRSQTEPLA